MNVPLIKKFEAGFKAGVFTGVKIYPANVTTNLKTLPREFLMFVVDHETPVDERAPRGAPRRGRWRSCSRCSTA